MRTVMFGTACALALAATPVLAQSSSNQSSGQSNGQSGQSAKPMNGQQQTPQIQAMSQDKLRTDLRKAGFSDITVLDAAYLVQANTSDGNKVVMFINPPSMQSGNQASGGKDSSGSSGSTQQSSSSN